MRDILKESGEVGFGPESRFMGGAPRFGVYTRPGLTREFGSADGSLGVSDARRLLAQIFSPHSKSVWRDVFWQRLALIADPGAFTEEFIHTRRRAQDLYDLALQVHAQGRIPGDKSPANLWYVEDLLKWFPRARVIHMIRDPRATYTSMLRKGWVGPQRFNLPDVKPLRLGIGSVTAVDIAYEWRRAVKLDSQYRMRFPDRYLRCRFEDLITDPLPQVQQISKFVGVPYRPQMLERDVINSTYLTRGTPGFRPEFADAWRAHLDRPLSRWFSRLTGSALVEQGYPRT